MVMRAASELSSRSSYKELVLHPTRPELVHTTVLDRRMIITQPSDLWYKNAIVYCIDVSAFFDSNCDGMGDFNGLTSKLDYLTGLGVTCIWLMPFYPSPQRDGGYDVVDY